MLERVKSVHDDVDVVGLSVFEDPSADAFWGFGLRFLVPHTNRTRI